MKNKSSRYFLFLFLLMLLFLALPYQPAYAIQLTDKVAINGFGHQGFLLPNHNRTMGADSRGSFDLQEVALLFSAKVLEDWTVWTQIWYNSERLLLDWAMVDYKLNENIKLDVGQVRMPVGLLNNIRDIRYLQLSSLQPLMYHEESQMIQEAFRGGAFHYVRDLAQGGVDFDLYGGQQVNQEENADEKYRQLVGGRLKYRTPLEGLSLMASAYTNKVEVTESETGEFRRGQMTTVLGSLDYKPGNFDLKAEIARTRFIDTDRDSYYVQAGYTLFNSLTPYLRYDYFTPNRDLRSNPAAHQEELVVGIDYKVNEMIALKVENHFISGYALPVAEEEVMPGEGRKDWNLFAASLNFMF